MRKRSRIYYLWLMSAILCLFLLGRLAYIQVIKGNYFAKKAEEQRIGSSNSARGGVFDRNGELLSDTFYEKHVVISPGMLSKDEKDFITRMDFDFEDNGKPQDIKIPEDCISVITKKKLNTPGVFVYDKAIRYGDKALATHTIGYLGQTGIEKTFDHILSQGKKIDLVKDGLRQPIVGLSNDVEQIPSWGVKLTIDKRIQSIVESVMDKRIDKGAVLVLDANSSEILAIASRPNYKQYRLNEYLERDDSPLINRSVEGYTPGSIFKIVMLAAALEENICDLDEKFFCPGYTKVGENVFKCSSFKDGGHGVLSIRDAMAYSCNSVFIQLGIRLGEEKIIEYANRFGLGKKVNIGLPEEKKGFIPLKQDVYYQDIGNLSLGQGKMAITPLQASQILLPIVNNGVLKKPYLIKEVTDFKGNIVYKCLETKPIKVISTMTAQDVKKALAAVTSYGTGKNAMPANANMVSAGKTGTAEVGKDLYHAWFTGFYPIDNPRYIITVFIEKGGSASSKAAPAFKEIADEIISKKAN